MAKCEAWEIFCPLETYFTFLKSAGLIDKAMRKTMAGEIMEVFDYALASPNPTEQDLYTRVYED